MRKILYICKNYKYENLYIILKMRKNENKS